MDRFSSTEGWGVVTFILVNLFHALVSFCVGYEVQDCKTEEKIQRGAQAAVVQAQIHPQCAPSRLRRKYRRPAALAIWRRAIVIAIISWLWASSTVGLPNGKRDFSLSVSIQALLKQRIFTNIQQLDHVVAFGTGFVSSADEVCKVET